MKNFKKMFELLSSQEKKRFFLLLILTFIMAILDMVGVASILPFISVLSNPKIIETNIYLLKIYNLSSALGINSVQQFIFLLGIVVFILLIFSLFIKIITIYFQTRFALMREYSISKRLVECYLRQPYIWFLNRNSSDLGKIILSEVIRVIEGVLIPIINIISQSIVALAILFLIILVNPVLSFVIAMIIILSYLIIFNFVKKSITRFGNIRFQKTQKDF